MKCTWEQPREQLNQLFWSSNSSHGEEENPFNVGVLLSTVPVDCRGCIAQDQTGAMDQVMTFIDPFKQLSKDSIRLIKRCTKPDRKEFQKIAMATAIGFAIMGFIGFFVKLIHIPINNIIVGS
ncbi:protein transport protein Sec61 subunit gamma [Ixodes scapularis]